MSQTEILKLGRGKGKTTEAIKYAKEHDLPILIPMKHEKRMIEADNPNLEIFSFDDFHNNKERGKRYNKPFVVDNLDYLFNMIVSDEVMAWVVSTALGIEIKLATINDDGKENAN